MKPTHTLFKTLIRWLVFFSRIYFVLLAGWLLAYLLRGDWNGLLTPLNALAPLLFLPLPLALLVGLFGRQRPLLVAGLGAALLFAILWGGLLLPGPGPADAHSSSNADHTDNTRAMRLMTFNVFGFNFDQQAVLEVVRQGDPDIVCFQELNPVIAAALQTELAAQYPYQALDARPGVTGMGVISKFPLQPRTDRLPGGWIGAPQTLDIHWQGRSSRLVNYHLSTPGRLSPASLLVQYSRRQEQAEALAAYAARVTDPLILCGDSNSADLNDAYRSITRGGLRDAWREAGFGLGFTFPRHLGSLQPAWMTRIDHVFISPDWTLRQASLARSAAGSDHRGVVVELELPSP